MQNRGPWKEMIGIALVDDKKADLVAHASLTAEHHLLSLTECFARKKRKTKR